MITFVLIAVVCSNNFSLTCGYQQKVFETFVTKEECLETAKIMAGSGVAVRWYCKTEESKDETRNTPSQVP